MFVLFGSPLMGLVGFLPNIIPALIYYGIMGWIGAPLDVVTAVFGGVVTGVAVDDTLHMMLRFAQENGPPAEKVERSLVKEFIPVSATTAGASGCFCSS